MNRTQTGHKQLIITKYNIHISDFKFEILIFLEATKRRAMLGKKYWFTKTRKKVIIIKNTHDWLQNYLSKPKLHSIKLRKYSIRPNMQPAGHILQYITWGTGRVETGYFLNEVQADWIMGQWILFDWSMEGIVVAVGQGATTRLFSSDFSYFSYL